MDRRDPPANEGCSKGLGAAPEPARPGVQRFAKRSPQWLDARSLAMHRLIVAKVRENPELFDRLQRNLNRWRETVPAGNLPYLDAWQRLVDQGREACFAVALEDSDHGQAMRQCSPFAGTLSNQERWVFLKAWEAREAI